MRPTIEILTADFSPERRLAEFRREFYRRGSADQGAITAFVGSVRGNGDELKYLLIEAYPKMANRQLTELAQRVAARFTLGGLLIIHRIGRLKVGQPIVLAAVAAKHRRQAFLACEFVVEALKTDIALWKCEVNRDGSRRWIEPPEKS